MDPITVFKGKSVGIPIANIDTDQITPARYLKGTSKKLADAFFIDWRKDSDFSLNKPGAKGATIPFLRARTRRSSRASCLRG